MTLHDELSVEQRTFIDEFLLEDLLNSQVFPFSVFFNTTSVLCGYRSVAESAWTDYDSTEITKSTPEPPSLSEFYEKSGVPHLKVHRDEPASKDKNSSTVTYLLFESDAYEDALDIMKTFTKDPEDLPYHQKLGELLGYPEFASKDFKEHGWEEPSISEKTDIILEDDGDLLDLTLSILGIPYSFPYNSEYYENVVDDIRIYRSQVRLYIDEYEYIQEAILQSQRHLIEEVSEEHEYIDENNVVHPRNI